MKRHIPYILAFCLVLTSSGLPLVVRAAGGTTTCGTTSGTFCSIIIGFVELMNKTTWLLSGVALLIFMWGLVRFIYHGGDQKGYKEGKALITWGLIALFIIFSLGGVLNLMCFSFLGTAC